VGRPRELALLRSLIPAVRAEGRRIALLGGEPGSGKTSLVRELAHSAAADGVLVLHGGCDAVVRTPYRPVIEALDHLVRVAEPSELVADLGVGGGELTRLLPELPSYAGSLPEPVKAEPDTERHRLHTAVADFLTAASQRHPLLVILEDGHWADTPSLLLLRHLSNRATAARMLLVATFRDTEADVPQELSEALVDLRRAEGVVRMRLSGLESAEVAEFVSRAAGGDFGDDLPRIAAAIKALTDGNPFLVTELWRQMTETGVLELLDGGRARLTRPLSRIGTPEGVREVVSQRLGRLDPVAADLLELAAVAGPEFDPAVLSAAAGVDQRSLVEPLEGSVASGMIAEVPGRSLRFRFTHELVRRALYDRLSTLRRAELHLSIGEALAASGSGNAAVIAHHFAEAAGIGGRDRAIQYSLLASRSAAQALAFQEAAGPLRTALELGLDDEGQRAEIQLELGWACFRGGESVDAMRAYWSAAQIAARLGDRELLARAAIGYENVCYRQGVADEGALELLSDAAGQLAAGDSGLRVVLLSGLARALAYAGDIERGSIVRDNALAMARRLGDRRGLATVLARSYYWVRGDTPLDEVIAMISEGRDLAVELGDVELEAEALEWRIAAEMSAGDLAAATRDLAVTLKLVERTRQPFMLHIAEHYRSALALAQGRIAEAEEAAEQSREWGKLLTGRDASGVFGIQMFGVRREQGRLAELAPLVRVLSAERAGDVWRPGFVALLAELGMADEARRELAELRADGFDKLRQSLWLASLAYLADACALIGDAETAELVYPALLPSAGTMVMVGHGVAIYGSADRYLGMLARVLGDRAAAATHFAEAVRADEARGADTWLAHSLYEQGRLLVGGDEEEREHAGVVLARAEALADAIGLPVLLGRVRALNPAPATARALPDGLSEREAEILRQVARGLSNRDIGRSLFISEHTVANHVRSILRKTASANRTEAAAYAHTRGLIER
jgi:DNA-binding CsgD family transcriptional regulator/tetratricopeptide (TPR) repeat protein